MKFQHLNENLTTKQSHYRFSEGKIECSTLENPSSINFYLMIDLTTISILDRKYLNTS